MNAKNLVVALTVMAAATGLAGTAVPSGATTSAAYTPVAFSSTAPGAAPFGPACSKVPNSGPGSFSGMAADPVASAASHNPVLSTLVTAAKKAGLVDTLNSAKNITVFAPANSAFQKIPPATLNKLLANKAQLSKVLTYHVVGQRITPQQLSSGSFKTLEGATVKTSGSGQNFTINGKSHVVCGDVQTANATVYIIDSVLMPTG